MVEPSEEERILISQVCHIYLFTRGQLVRLTPHIFQLREHVYDILKTEEQRSDHFVMRWLRGKPDTKCL